MKKAGLMEITFANSNNSSSWEIVPANAATVIVLAILFFYLLFRQFIFVLMFTDVILGWLREFDWFPRDGKRFKTFIHWLIALGMFLGFLAVGRSQGWLEFIPK